MGQVGDLVNSGHMYREKLGSGLSAGTAVLTISPWNTMAISWAAVKAASALGTPWWSDSLPISLDTTSVGFPWSPQARRVSFAGCSQGALCFPTPLWLLSKLFIWLWALGGQGGGPFVHCFAPGLKEGLGHSGCLVNNHAVMCNVLPDKGRQEWPGDAAWKEGMEPTAHAVCVRARGCAGLLVLFLRPQHFLFWLNCFSLFFCSLLTSCSFIYFLPFILPFSLWCGFV